MTAWQGCPQAPYRPPRPGVRLAQERARPVAHWVDEWAGILNLPSQFSLSPMEVEAK
jgi:hypothetical protein